MGLLWRLTKSGYVSGAGFYRTYGFHRLRLHRERIGYTLSRPCLFYLYSVCPLEAGTRLERVTFRL